MWGTSIRGAKAALGSYLLSSLDGRKSLLIPVETGLHIEKNKIGALYFAEGSPGGVLLAEVLAPEFWNLTGVSYIDPIPESYVVGIRGDIASALYLRENGNLMFTCHGKYWDLADKSLVDAEPVVGFTRWNLVVPGRDGRVLPVLSISAGS